jgi:hypothetical protein
MATILGITGAIGSGKTTISNFLAELEPQHAVYESGQVIAELADAFNQALTSELSFGIPTSDTELVNQTLIWFTEAINEQLHQDVTWNQLALTRHRLAVHEQHYEKLFAYLRDVRTTPDIATQTITKENKAAYRALLQWLGGYLVITISKTIWFDEIFRRVDLYDADKRLVIINGLRYPSDAETVSSRGGLIVEVTRPNLQSDTKDVTEAERSKIHPDTILINSGALEELKNITEKLWLDVSISQLAKEYAKD